MSSRNQGPSKRFQPSVWTERLVPVVLIILLLVLVATIVFVILSMLGLTAGL